MRKELLPPRLSDVCDGSVKILSSCGVDDRCPRRAEYV